MDIVIVLFGLTVLFKAKYAGRGKFFDDYISVEQCNILKGIFAVFVMLFHIYGVESHGYIFRYCGGLGYIGVAVFLVISGYGLTYQWQKKQSGYLHGFVKRRIGPLLTPFLIMFVISAIYKKVTFTDILESVGTGKTVVEYSWFVFAIVYFYFAFLFAAKLSKGKKGVYIVGLTVFYCMYTAWCFLMKYDNGWRVVTHCFLFGSLYSLYKEPLEKAIKKFFWIIFFALTAIFFVFYIRQVEFFSLEWDASVGIYATAFAVLTFMFCSKVKLQSPVMRSLSRVSYELYVTHGLVLRVLRDVGLDKYNINLFGIAVIAGAIALSYALHYSIFFVKKGINKVIAERKTTV